MSTRRAVFGAGLMAFALALGGVETATASPEARKPPEGVSYWIDSGDNVLVAVRRHGRKVNIGSSPLSPCFTGIHTNHGKYKGGGYNSGSGYTKGVVRLRVYWDGEKLTLQDRRWPPRRKTWKYYRATRAEALDLVRHYGGTSLKGVFLDCKLP